MEEVKSVAGRVITTQFDFDRNGQRLLARAYHQLLADANTPTGASDSVQTGKLPALVRSNLQEVNR